MCQVAFSVADLETTSAWYRDVFGLVPAGGARFSGPAIERLQGLPGATSRARWLVDLQDFFQLELFCFEEPAPRRFAQTRSPADIGYSALGIHASDFDQALARLGEAATPVLDGGRAGRRRAVARDPDGVLVELMEDRPRSGGPATRRRPEVQAEVVYVRASVPDLERSVRFFAGVTGLSPLAEPIIHAEADEALWGLAGARRLAAELHSDGPVLELVQYLRPAGRDRPADYRISDLGLLNVAFGSRDLARYQTAKGRLIELGHRTNEEMRLDFAATVYGEDDQGFSVELLYLKTGSEGLAGFEPRPWKVRSYGSQPGGR